MRKVDTFSLSISITLNLIMIILLSTFNAPKEVAGKIKVGLVSLENSNSANYEGFKDKTGDKPVTPPKKEETPVVENKTEVKKELSLEERLKEIQIAAPKLDTPTKKGVPVKDLKAAQSQASSQSSSNETEAPIKTFGKGDGIPSGYKLGALDGDIDAKWNPNNREPEYPQSAQMKGIGGTVRLRLTIDEYGNVKNVIFNKGSGVPEIDLAIEKVARTWKINLTKKSKTVYGDVILEYDFKLTGN